MNEKDIQSFSLATLIDVCGRRPGDICYDGCLIASRVNVQDEIDIDLFHPCETTGIETDTQSFVSYDLTPFRGF